MFRTGPPAHEKCAQEVHNMVQGAQIYTYTQLAKMVNASRNKQVKLANNTTAHSIDNEKIGIKLHWTDVLVINTDDSYELYTGGYWTNTTKNRLNAFSPAKVVQRDFEFYVLKHPFEGTVKANMVPFEEGLTVDDFGNVKPEWLN
jgi:hypothetical protein